MSNTPATIQCRKQQEWVTGWLLPTPFARWLWINLLLAFGFSVQGQLTGIHSLESNWLHSLARDFQLELAVPCFDFRSVLLGHSFSASEVEASDINRAKWAFPMDVACLSSGSERLKKSATSKESSCTGRGTWAMRIMKLAKSQPHSAAKLLSRKQIQSCCKSPVRSTQAVWEHKLRVCQSSGCASAFIPCSLLRLTGNADSWSCRDSSTDLGNYH